MIAPKDLLIGLLAGAVLVGSSASSVGVGNLGSVTWEEKCQDRLGDEPKFCSANIFPKQEIVRQVQTIKIKGDRRAVIPSGSQPFFTVAIKDEGTKTTVLERRKRLLTD